MDNLFQEVFSFFQRVIPVSSCQSIHVPTDCL